MVTVAPILQPEDNNYLTSRILFNQFQNNSIEPTIFTGFGQNGITPLPKLLLDGSSRAYLNGSVTVTNGAPSAGMSIFSLPPNITIPQNYIFPVAVLRGSTTVFNSIELNYVGSGIESVNISNGGVYTTLATPVLGAPGAGAILVPEMGANAITAFSNPGTGYVPGDIITAPIVAGVSVPAQITVVATQVVSATVYNGGTGGTTGTHTVTGTTGVGTPFQASVTIAGGAITAVNSITVGGIYTTKPTSLLNEPVTGAGLVGASLSLVMGVSAANGAVITNPGVYTTLPGGNFIIQGSATGSGEGANFIVNWKLVNVLVSNPGAGYTSASTITFTGTGSGAVATLELGQNADEVTAILVDTPNTNDIVYFDGIVFFTNSYTI
jgi:hypothetical protein